MTQLSPEDQAFISNLRLRSLPNAENPPTLNEMKKAIVILRSKRTAAVEASAAGRKSAPKKSPPSAEAVASALDDLDIM